MEPRPWEDLSQLAVRHLGQRLTKEENAKTFENNSFPYAYEDHFLNILKREEDKKLYIYPHSN